MEKISCNVIRDLLPLYCDDICSPESLALIKNHLETCPECSALLEKMKTECHLSQEIEQEHEEVIKDMAATWKKSIFKSFLKGFLAAILACLLLASAYWGLSRWVLITVPYTDVQATILNVTDTHVEICLETTDGKKIRESSMEFAEDGTYYITLKRGVISPNNGNINNYSGTHGVPRNITNDDGVSMQMIKLCYGTPEKNVVIWEEE